MVWTDVVISQKSNFGLQEETCKNIYWHIWIILFFYARSKIGLLEVSGLTFVPKLRKKKQEKEKEKRESTVQAATQRNFVY